MQFASTCKPAKLGVGDLSSVRARAPVGCTLCVGSANGSGCSASLPTQIGYKVQQDARLAKTMPARLLIQDGVYFQLVDLNPYLFKVSARAIHNFYRL